MTPRGCTAEPAPEDLEAARAWIGRRLTLRRRCNGFAPGTACVVMCVVDFGDGPLLWVATDDARLDDVDQVAVGEVMQRFRMPAPPGTGLAAAAVHGPTTGA